MPQEPTPDESTIKELKKRIAELEDQIANYQKSGTAGPTHASSAGLENYPQVPPQGEPTQEQAKPKQPLSGTAATAEQHPK
jgi:hypothetical protein